MFQVFPANLGSDSLFQKIQRQHNLFEWLIVSFLGPDFSAPTQLQSTLLTPHGLGSRSM